MLELLKFDGEDDMCICSTYGKVLHNCHSALKTCLALQDYLSAEAEHVISCLSVDACDTETPEQRIVIGTTGGEVKVLSDDLNDLMSFHNSADHVSLYSQFKNLNLYASNTYIYREFCLPLQYFQRKQAKSML